jgi:uncharacterized phiE125 gp8 family phage protein
MALKLTSPPSAEPISLEEAKSHCRISTTADDGLVAGYILAARQHVQTQTGRVFVTQSWDYLIDGFWPVYLDATWRHERKLIQIPLSPVQQVTGITYVDPNGATQTLATDQYRVYGLHDASQPAGQNPGIARIEPAFGVWWPIVMPEAETIRVSFTAGYGGPGCVHEAIRQAMLMLISHFYDNRAPLGAPGSVEIPYAIDALLADHKLQYGAPTTYGHHRSRFFST